MLVLLVFSTNFYSAHVAENYGKFIWVFHALHSWQLERTVDESSQAADDTSGPLVVDF